jgi:hypothetical protein
MKIMVSGNHTVKQLSPRAIQMLDRIIQAGHKICIGDCSGVDFLVQQYLAEKQYRNVRVVHIKSVPRHNIGFPAIKVKGKRYADKDKMMVRWADSGLFVFDLDVKLGTGTGRAMKQLLERGKRCVSVVNAKDTYRIEGGESITK